MQQERMHAMKKMFVLALVGCALAGCSGVGSVNPICTQDSTVALSGVLGTWSVKDTEGVVVISSGEYGSHMLRFREDDGTLKTFDVLLTKIGGALFADLHTQDGSKDAPLNMPVHLFAKVEVTENTVKLFFPDGKWFDARLTQRPNAIHHIKQYAKGEEGWMYLTDGTKQVRAFIRSCAKHPEAFVEKMTLVKVSDSQDLPPEAPTLRLK